MLNAQINTGEIVLFGGRTSISEAVFFFAALASLSLIICDILALQSKWYIAVRVLIAFQNIVTVDLIKMQQMPGSLASARSALGLSISSPRRGNACSIT